MSSEIMKSTNFRFLAGTLVDKSANGNGEFVASIDQIGSFTDGYYMPTPSEFIYFDSLPDVYSGANLKVTGIPVAYGSVSNILGGQNTCIFLLASKIEVY